MLVHSLAMLAKQEGGVPGNVDERDPFLLPRADALVLGPHSRTLRRYAAVCRVSRRWHELAQVVPTWRQLRELSQPDGSLRRSELTTIVDDAGGACWAASSTTREEGKEDTWETVELPCDESSRTVMLTRKCNDEGISYDVVRWIGCLQGLHHPSIAALQLVSAAHVAGQTTVHAAFEHCDTSLQQIVYGTLERTSHTVIGRALPPVMLRSFMYQLLSALACCHARGVPHGNLAPYRVLATTLDAERDLYLLKLADFGFSPPLAAQCNEELPIRPSRASPELGQEIEHKRYGAANDLWALGTVFAETACGNRDPVVYMMIQDLENTPEPTLRTNLPMIGEDGRDLIRKLMTHEPSTRITAAEALRHPYFDGLHDQCEVVSAHLPRLDDTPTPFLELRLERGWQPGDDFLGGHQSELNPRMWSILFDWLSVVSHKFKFVPRSLQLACDFMRRYMSVVDIERRRLQLVGIGALCLACKHEEVMIPNMNDFIFICDSAYSLGDLMSMEIEMLNTLSAYLHVPTAHDHLAAMLVTMGAMPDRPDGSVPPPLVDWCECLTLIGLAHHKVTLCEPASLARCVAALGACLHGEEGVKQAGDWMSAKSPARLANRARFLQPEADLETLRHLVLAIEMSVRDQREILLKCHTKLTELCELPSLLGEYSCDKSAALRPSHVAKCLDRYCSVERMLELNFYNEFPLDEVQNFGKKRAFLRGTASQNGPAVFNIVAVSYALAQHLIAELE